MLSSTEAHAAIIQAEETVSPMYESLVQADNVLFWIGCGVTFAWIATWLLLRKGDPLANAPQFGKRLDPTGALMPMLAYMFFASLFTMATEYFEPGCVMGMMTADYAARVMGALACCWVASLMFDGGVRRFLIGEGNIARNILLGVGMFLIAMFSVERTMYATLRVISEWWPHYVVFDHDVIQNLKRGEVPRLLVWIGTALLVPIAEECFFRGILQTCLSNYLRNRWVVVVMSGLFFGAIHAGIGDTPQPHVVPALSVLGMLLGGLYMATGSLIGPIVLHVLFNSKTLLWEALQ